MATHHLRGLLVFALLCVTGVAQFASVAQIPDTLRERADEDFEASRWDGAITGYSSLIKADGKDARSWYRLGYSYHALEKYNAAIEAYQHAIDLKFNRMLAQFNIACAYARMEDNDKAIAALDRALDMGYNVPFQIQQDVDLLTLRGTPGYDSRIERARRPVESLAEGRKLDIPVGRWSVEGAFDTIGNLTVNATSREFARHFELIQGGKRNFYLMFYYDASQSKWFAEGADKDGAVYSSEANVSPGSVSCRGRMTGQDGTVESRWTLTIDPTGSGRVTVEDRSHNGWQERMGFRLKREDLDGGR